jgi:hypothetical protein
MKEEKFVTEKAIRYESRADLSCLQLDGYLEKISMAVGSGWEIEIRYGFLSEPQNVHFHIPTKERFRRIKYKYRKRSSFLNMYLFSRELSYVKIGRVSNHNAVSAFISNVIIRPVVPRDSFGTPKCPAFK